MLRLLRRQAGPRGRSFGPIASLWPQARHDVLVLAWSSALVLITLGPLLGRGYWLWADAVSVPRSFLTDQALGVGEAAPRATPQDAALAAMSSVVDGGLVVKAITVLALLAAGTGAARLVRTVLPQASDDSPASHATRAGGAPRRAFRASGGVAQLVAATFAIDNLWVGERLLQGQWSLLVGYGALGHVAVVALRLRAKDQLREWAELGFWLAAGGFVPTGWFFVVILAGALVPVRKLVPLVLAALVAASPWLVAGLLGLSRNQLGESGTAGVTAFAARLDGIAWLVLGGIWNAHSVPASMRGTSGQIIDFVLLMWVMLGTFLVRHRLSPTSSLRALFVLAFCVVALVGFSATGLGQDVLTGLIGHVPPLGVLRDTQKWAALAWPAYAVALAALCRKPPAGWLFLPAMMLLVGHVLADVRNQLGTVHYPDGWFEVRDRVSADPGHGALLTVPAGITRRYVFAHGRVSIDPAPRLLPVPVAQTGDLVVDGNGAGAGGASRERGEWGTVAGGLVVPGEGTLARRGVADLQAGASPEQFARDGIGWVLVERGELCQLPGPANDSLAQFELVHADDGLVLYRNPKAPSPVPRVSPAARLVVVLAHFAWAALLVIGAGAALRRGRPTGSASAGDDRRADAQHGRGGTSRVRGTRRFRRSH